MAILISTNPAKNYEKVGHVEISSKKEIHSKVVFANKAKSQWKEIGVSKRIQFMKRIKDVIIKRREDFIKLITLETGKPINESKEEFDQFFINPFNVFLERGDKYLKDEITYSNDKIASKVVFEPYGIAGVILPWNFPLEMFVWGVVPNLIVGNTVVMKHAEECPLVGKLIEESISNVNLPEGVFSEVYGDGKIGESLVNEDINLLSFTGSSKVGKYLYGVIGRKGYFVKSVMELGGSSPGIVFADANVDSALEKFFINDF